MRTVFLVPRRNDDGHRDKLWKWCKARWQALMPDIDIVEGHHADGPFNRSEAINTAAKLADADGRWDVGVVIDADVFHPIPSVRAAIDSAAAGKVTWAHRRWRNIAEKHLARLLKYPDTFGEVPAESRDMDLLVDDTTSISWSCCVAVPRATFDAMTGFDERFIGWGFEDGAWAALVRARYPWSRIDGDMYHLWHERTPERIILGESGTTASNDYVRNALLGRRYMVAAIRDHGTGDQMGEERLSPEMVRVHVANLKRADQRFLQMVRQRKMPEADWVSWWPDIDELQEGARAYLEEKHRPSVTVVLHTGGSPEAWEARSAYLRQSLASLTENVTGPIVQRVIYSDWGPDRLVELQEIGGPFGFYVAGEGHHGYTGSMKRMWRYLAKRATGDYIFGAEDDFTYVRPVDLRPMIQTLADNAHLVQVALLRDAFYQDERETGGILGWPEPAFTRIGQNGTSRMEHRLFWTANPSIFRRSLTTIPWPEGKHSETLFGKRVLADPKARAAFWGSGEEWVAHIGAVRAGSGY